MQLLHEQQLNNLKGEWQNENLQITADTGSLEDVIRFVCVKFFFRFMIFRSDVRQ